MFSAAVDTALVCAVAVITLAVVGFLGFRLSRSYRDLGSDADRATYATLHTATLASEHLREGLTPAGATRAARHLRGLLRCDVLIISDDTAVLAREGARGDHPDLMPLVTQVLATGRTQIVRRQRLDALGVAEPGELVLSPIRVGKHVVGTVGAFTRHVDAGLVRATTELAGWVSTQVGLAELDSSRRLLAEAEVRALRAQISPHFIYNSLNAIASFITTDPQRARELVVEFADFTRYSFRRHGEFTTVAEELRSIDRYLLLERARFGDRLRVRLEIGPEVLSTVIPFLSLQPLVENAVRHGLESKDGTGNITITAHDAGAFAEVTVEDDGVGIDPEHLRSVLAGHTEDIHVGLRNVDARLRQVYGDEHGLVIDTAPGAGTLITLRVPKSQPGHRA
ncbi:histidine kinase [Arthrobacter sp. RIT-PI-e]|uniref:histidine kinase n=1 Tax=Arthrobacter sp. RIT-PI-e TaxID=1681197 RepID=UPI000676278C|nr:histidine kinase [Arthrobacter sp. RIT-PI-e]KNC19013.1 histidine kinase [Arthrobacter sp. RIT-PI-e]